MLFAQASAWLQMGWYVGPYSHQETGCDEISWDHWDVSPKGGDWVRMTRTVSSVDFRRIDNGWILHIDYPLADDHIYFKTFKEVMAHLSTLKIKDPKYGDWHDHARTNQSLESCHRVCIPQKTADGTGIDRLPTLSLCPDLKPHYMHNLPCTKSRGPVLWFLLSCRWHNHQTTW